MSTIFTVSDYNQLLTLHRAVMEAKFSELPNDTVLIGSRLLAETSNQIVDTLSQWEIARGRPEKYEQWEKWRAIDESRREWNIAVQHVKGLGNIWDSWSTLEKEAYIRIIISPFEVDNLLIQKFLETVNNK